jgi:hypothetical protein
VRRQARALRAERLLDDLDENLLPFLEEILDSRLDAGVVFSTPFAALRAG